MSKKYNITNSINDEDIKFLKSKYGPFCSKEKYIVYKNEYEDNLKLENVLENFAQEMVNIEFNDEIKMIDKENRNPIFIYYNKKYYQILSIEYNHYFSRPDAYDEDVKFHSVMIIIRYQNMETKELGEEILSYSQYTNWDYLTFSDEVDQITWKTNKLLILPRGIRTRHFIDGETSISRILKLK